MATKISKKADAPEGDIKVSIANLNFKVSDDAPYETDDRAIAAFIAASYSEFFDVEDTDDVDIKATARQEAKDANKLAVAQEKAELARAEKNPLDPAPVVPETVNDLYNNADSEGGK